MKTSTKVILAVAALGGAYVLLRKPEKTAEAGPPSRGQLVFEFRIPSIGGKQLATAAQIESAAKDAKLVEAINACGPIKIESYSLSGIVGDNVVIVYWAYFPSTFPLQGDYLSAEGTTCMYRAFRDVGSSPVYAATDFKARARNLTPAPK